MFELMGKEQLWISDKWYLKFSRLPDPGETGVGHTTEQARSFISPEINVIMDYHRAVVQRIEEYIINQLN
ncbi:MAG: hypothetical protein PHE50_09945 [Dehalococcoidales bacterium]|nr:hypothetical protein [Dehalococcoidales bacterium]